MTSNNHKKIGKIMLAVAAITLVTAMFSGCLGGDDTETLSIAGSTTVLPIAQQAADAYMDAHNNVDIQVSAGGSSVGVSSVGDGTADIGMASRELKDSETAAYPNLVQHVVARDGIALIVHPNNAVSQLTIAQVRGIYNGTYTNWNQLGGSNMDIVAVGRDSASGTREFFWEFVMEKEDFVAGMLEMNSNGAVHSKVSTTQGAIGFVGLGYVDNEVKGLNIENNGQYVVPTVQNVIDDKYPIARNLNMFTDGPATGLAKDFLDFVKSPTGQQIVEDEGFVPL
ncbi:MAG: phosphate ABC transporter substrate-binding protein [Candidatus Thermoplasmatota archaeon]|nr:phosphate ABC transporter substrate-binding protein [Candidatus Thermoplasmatota archaeon]